MKTEPHANEKQSSMKNRSVGAEPECWTLTVTNLGYFKVERTILLPSLALLCYFFHFLGCLATSVWEERQ